MGELIAEFDNYSIYKVYNKIFGNYYLCVPKNINSRCNFVLGFLEQDANTITNNDLVNNINDVYKMISTINNDSIYIVPEIPVSTLEQAALENDMPMYSDIFYNKINPIVLCTTELLIKIDIDPKDYNKVNQIIQVIVRNDNDKKFAGWMSLQPNIGSFIKEIKYEYLKNEYLKKIGIHTIDIEFSNSSNETVFHQPIKPIDRTYENDSDNDKSQEMRLVRRPQNNNGLPGFSSFSFIIVTLLLALIFGVSIGYLIMK